MIDLDERERAALQQFIRYLQEERFDGVPTVDEGSVVRQMDGQILVPVSLATQEPNLHLALLMARKADHVYKQTGCRFLLAQRPLQDPKQSRYVWADGAWQAV